MKRPFLLLFLLFLFTDTNAERRDSVMQIEQTNPRRFYTFGVVKEDPVNRHTWKYYLKRYVNEEETMLRLDTLVLDRTCHDWPINAINIQFVNDSVGYIFGHTVGYGYCSFIFRTADYGNSWQRLSIGNRHNTLSSKKFYMFNEYQGIALPYIYGDTLSYYLTERGKELDELQAKCWQAKPQGTFQACLFPQWESFADT
jgi:hypothetical protein